MLAIRMQRTGRKGHAMFRMVVQDAHRTPTSGKVVAQIGSYDPHAKTVTLQKDKASFYLSHGAQPSDRVVRLLVSEGVDLPAWVKQPTTDAKRTTRNPDKRRSTQPAQPKEAEVAAEAPAEAEQAPAAEVAESTEQLAETPEATTKAEALVETEKKPDAEPKAEKAAETPAEDAEESEA